MDTAGAGAPPVDPDPDAHPDSGTDTEENAGCRRGWATGSGAGMDAS
ncbi:hypothetical protein [Streptomyces galbus]